MIVPCNNYSLNHQSVWTLRLNMPSLRAVYTEAVYQTVEPLEVKQAKGKMYDYLRKEQSLVLQIFFGKKKKKTQWHHLLCLRITRQSSFLSTFLAYNPCSEKTNHSRNHCKCLSVKWKFIQERYPESF